MEAVLQKYIRMRSARDHPRREALSVARVTWHHTDKHTLRYYLDMAQTPTICMLVCVPWAQSYHVHSMQCCTCMYMYHVPLTPPFPAVYDIRHIQLYAIYYRSLIKNDRSLHDFNYLSLFQCEFIKQKGMCPNFFLLRSNHKCAYTLFSWSSGPWTRLKTSVSVSSRLLIIYTFKSSPNLFYSTFLVCIGLNWF